MVDIQSLTAEIRRGKKEEERKKKDRSNHRMKILWPALFHRAAMKSDHNQIHVLTELWFYIPLNTK